jgi:hypothetical protein
VTNADIAERGEQDHVARLRALLAELENAAPLPRTDPRSLQQLALCAEVESILHLRSRERATQRSS